MTAPTAPLRLAATLAVGVASHFLSSGTAAGGRITCR